MGLSEGDLILAVDVGGTKTDIGLVPFVSRGKVGAPVALETLPTGGHASFPELIDSFRSRHSGAVRSAAVGFAGVVRRGRGDGTNVPWPIDAGAVARQLSLPSVLLINDLAAMGYGVAALGPKDLEAVIEAEPAPDGNAGVLSAGTGLGVTILARIAGDYVPIASEGGHADFAPRTDLELEIFRALRARFGRVSSERVLSGPGLVHVAEVLHDSTGSRDAWARHATVGPPEELPHVVTGNALEGRCETCARALDCFAGIYGAEAGNLALRSMAVSGIYLGGGIAPHILPALRSETFRRAFLDKAPHEDLLARIPVWVIAKPHATLLGAARFAALAAA
jgi:glucokinase